MDQAAAEERPARGPCLTLTSEGTKEHAAYVIHLTIKSHPEQPETWLSAWIPQAEEFWERISIPLSSVLLEQKAPRGAVINGDKSERMGQCV